MCLSANAYVQVLTRKQKPKCIRRSAHAAMFPRHYIRVSVIAQVLTRMCLRVIVYASVLACNFLNAGAHAHVLTRICNAHNVNLCKRPCSYLKAHTFKCWLRTCHNISVYEQVLTCKCLRGYAFTQVKTRTSFHLNAYAPALTHELFFHNANAEGLSDSAFVKIGCTKFFHY